MELLFPSALATAGRLFPTPLPEADVTALAKPTAVRPKTEPPGPAVESRTGMTSADPFPNKYTGMHLAVYTYHNLFESLDKNASDEM